MSRILSVMFVLAGGLLCACTADDQNDGPDAAAGGGGGSGGAGGAITGGTGGQGGVITGGTTGGTTGGAGGATGGTGGAGGNPAECMPDECGPPPQPAMMCPDGSVAPAECARSDDGTCGWRMGECPPVSELCSLPLLTGPCEALIMRWGFDPEANDCVEFTYGGCEGNENNFMSREACLAACPPVASVACGARAGDPCGPAEFCDFGEQSSCGFDDGEGVCHPRPDACAEIDSPVCGCDGRTYSNACLGQVAGVDTLHPGACQEPPAGDCADLTRETIILSGGVSYGECLEGCVSTLTIAATSLNRAPPCDEVKLVVCDNGAGGPCTEHGGTLTVAAHDLARRLAADLVGVALMPEYGCPDCADGGASTLDLSRQGAHSSHRYETSNPPAELVDADAFVQGLIQSLRGCASTVNVDVLRGCVPRP